MGKNRFTFVASCFVLVVCFNFSRASVPCIIRKHSSDSLVCVCNSTYCDTLEITLPQNDKVFVLTSSKDGLRFKQQYNDLLTLIKRLKPNNYGRFGRGKLYQTIKGFGGALTDAASLNVMDLSVRARENFIKSYFGPEGIEYNMVRVPIGACDFSTRPYTYLDKANDFNLSTFALAPEDMKLKIPLLKQILDTSKKEVSLYSSPWSAPAWMKTNNNVTGYGLLRGKAGDKYHKTWAEYFTKFFDAYRAEGIHFWGVTMQNEPSNGLLVAGKWQCMGWSGGDQRDFIKTDLGPMLRQKGYGDIKLMILDDQRLFLLEWSKDILNDPEAEHYISGIAVHWYWDWLVGPEVLNETHRHFPDKFLLATEACSNTPPTESLGRWEDGEKYSNDVLDNLNNWAVGWVDWNMALNLQGGPNWANNLDNSPIIVNGSADEFYKQPMYYHLGHFSKLILEGSVRLHATSNVDSKIKYVVLFRPDNYYVVVILNKEDEDIGFVISIGDSSITLKSTAPKRSIQTYMWV